MASATSRRILWDWLHLESFRIGLKVEWDDVSQLVPVDFSHMYKEASTEHVLQYALCPNVSKGSYVRSGEESRYFKEGLHQEKVAQWWLWFGMSIPKVEFRSANSLTRTFFNTNIFVNDIAVERHLVLGRISFIA